MIQCGNPTQPPTFDVCDAVGLISAVLCQQLPHADAHGGQAVQDGLNKCTQPHLFVVFFFFSVVFTEEA
jgi:hypothetical protein